MSSGIVSTMGLGTTGKLFMRVTFTVRVQVAAREPIPSADPSAMAVSDSVRRTPPFARSSTSLV